MNTDNNESSSTNYQNAIHSLHDQISKTKSSIQNSSLQRKNTISSMQTYLSAIMGQDWNIPFIHITGSKGKGSTACYTESILRNHYGYTTGLYTSPHLIHVNERIRVNGRPVTDDVFASAYFEVRKRLVQNGLELPTYFRMLTLIALFIFRHYELDNQGIDVVILEVGMGGRYDATNVLPKVIGNLPFVCGVTMIDYEHTRILGDTLELIAAEKGGIFRHSIQEPSDFKYFYTISTNTPSVLNILQQCATEKIDDNPNDHPCEQLHIISTNENNVVGIPGKHQQINAQLAHYLSKSLHDQIIHLSSKTNINPMTISQAISETFWPARCHSIKYTSNINLHVDGAHTLPSINAYLSWLSTHLTSDSVILIFNCSHEKNPCAILQSLQESLLRYRLVSVYFCYPDSERPSMIDKPTTVELLKEVDDNVIQYDDSTWQNTLANVWRYMSCKSNKHEIITDVSVRDALDDIKEKYNGENVHVCITGSLYIAGSALKAADWKEDFADGNISF